MRRMSQKTRMTMKEAAPRETGKDLRGVGRQAQDLGRQDLGRSQVNGTKESGPTREGGGATELRLCYGFSSVSSVNPRMTDEINRKGWTTGLGL
jgi:hypothetical protein